MSTIYDLYRGLIGDSTGPYTQPDSRAFRYLDTAIDKLSQTGNYIYEEDLTVTSTDITNGYFTTTKDIQSLISFAMGGEDRWWRIGEGDRIEIIDSDAMSAGEYNIVYKARYKRFEGVSREDSYFDMPTDLYFAVALYAAGFYMVENGIIKVDGSMNAVRSKSEEGLSITYGIPSNMKAVSGGGEEIMQRALMLMMSHPTSDLLFFSVMS